MIKLDTEKIARHFHKYWNMTVRTTKENNMYMEGMSDILDSIGAIHPELVYDLYSLRDNIETRIEAEENSEL